MQIPSCRLWSVSQYIDSNDIDVVICTQRELINTMWLFCILGYKVEVLNVTVKSNFELYETKVVEVLRASKCLVNHSYHV